MLLNAGGPQFVAETVNPRGQLASPCDGPTENCFETAGAHEMPACMHVNKALKNGPAIGIMMEGK